MQLTRRARELVQLGVDLIITSGPGAAFAAKEATKTITIIFTVVPDPVETGLVDSLASPGGNVTGLALVDISPKAFRGVKVYSAWGLSLDRRPSRTPVDAQERVVLTS